MKIVGCNLHAKQQTIAVVDTDTGEFIERTLSHEGSVVNPGSLDSCASGFRYERTPVCRSESHE